MGVCSRCVYFRRVKPASQLLSGAIGPTAAAEITNALAKIVDDEQKVREGEIDVKSKDGARDRDRWAARPMMSEYCGLQESDDRFFICEVRNRGQQCGDFVDVKEHPPTRRACADCSHRMPGVGARRDEAAVRQFTQLVSAAIAVQASPQIAQGLIKGQRDSTVARKALEVSGAYASKGRMISRPEYLDHCGAMSTDEEFVICALHNVHHTCPEWQPARDTVDPHASSQHERH